MLVTRNNILVLILCSLFLFSGVLHARTARVYGYVVDQDNIGIEFANVVVLNTDKPIGTSTNKNGFYELVLDEADTVVLHFSMIGYIPVQQRDLIMNLLLAWYECECSLLAKVELVRCNNTKQP